MAFKGKEEKLISYLENGNIKMIKDCMRDEIRSVSGLGFPPKPYTQCQRVKRNLKKLSKISDVARELKKRVEKQELQMQLSLINQGEWKIASKYREYQISEDKLYQMNKDHNVLNLLPIT